MTHAATTSSLAARGRYAIHFAGRECGEERWSVARAADGAHVATGEQHLLAPHPFPSRQEYRATLSPLGRVTGLEVRWTIGARTLVARHAADGDLWRVRLEVDGQVREQEGDYPTFCEVLYGTHVFHTFALRRYVLAPGATHEFPALVIGPPFMAVEPGRQRLRCTAEEERATPFGPRRARRIELGDAGGSLEPPFAMWVDEHDVVLESLEGVEPAAPWMRLVEYERERG